MKKLFTLILFTATILTAGTGNAQPYESMFGSTSTAWVFTWANLMPGLGRDSAYVEKDTIVSGTTYTKVRLKVPMYHNALLREDVNTGQVWYREADTIISTPADTVERLVYDFSLQVGDTFRIDNVIFHDRLDTVTSVQTINGIKYIYFNSKFYDGEPYTMIEGIGDNIGIMGVRKVNVMQGPYLLCTYKNGEDQGKYTNKRYSGNCSPPLSVGNTAATGRQTYIYPNPAIDKVYVDGGHINRVIMTTMDGRKIKEITQAGIRSIDVQDVPAGIYLLHLSNDDGTTALERVCVAK